MQSEKQKHKKRAGIPWLIKRRAIEAGPKPKKELPPQIHQTYQTVSGICITPESEILLVWENEKKGWGFPGGGVETKDINPHKTLKKALLRELAEEIKYGAKKIYFFDKKDRLARTHHFAVCWVVPLSQQKIELLPDIPEAHEIDYLVGLRLEELKNFLLFDIIPEKIYQIAAVNNSKQKLNIKTCGMVHPAHREAAMLFLEKVEKNEIKL